MNTAHNHQVVFGRRESDCPRCAELAAGAPARKGWSVAKSVPAKTDRFSLVQAPRHVCTASCGPVCTFGDW